MASKEFQKKFKSTGLDAVATAGKQVTEYKFSMQCVDLGITKGEEGIAYPSSDDCEIFLNDLFSKNFAPKVLTEQAIAAMAKKGITPKKAIREQAYNVVITSSVEKVYAAVSIPKEWKDSEDETLKKYSDENADLEAFLKSILETAAAGQSTEVAVTTKSDNAGDYAFGCFEAKYPFKIRDEVLGATQQELTKRGLLVEEEDDDYIPDEDDDDGDW